MLGLPEEQVVVRYAAIGGAFGGREDLSIQHLLALAAWKLRRRGRRSSGAARSRSSATTSATRSASAAAGARRATADHGGRGRGARRRRRLRLDQRRGDQGRHALRHRRLRGPNIAVDGYAVYTNNVPSGAFRGFGAPQAQFAAEIMVTRLAHALGMDPIELRRRNIYREGSIEPTQQPLPPGVSALPVLERCVEEARTRFGGNESCGRRSTRPRPWIRRGIGIACGMKNLGYSFGFPEQSTATVEVRRPRRSRSTRLSGSARPTSARARTWRCARSPPRRSVLPARAHRDDHRRLRRGAERRQRLGLAPDPDGRPGRPRRRRARRCEQYRASDDERVEATVQYRPPATTSSRTTTGPASRTTATATPRRRSRSRSTP